MHISQETIAAAGALSHAARSGMPADALALGGKPLASLDEGYAVQDAWVARRIGDGARPIGWKIGGTSPESLRALGASGPIRGRLLDDMQIPDGGVCDTAKLQRPLVEVELAFRIGAPQQVAGAQVATVAFAPALEIVDSRLAPSVAGVQNVVADLSRACAFVLGEWVDADRVSAPEALHAMLTRDGEPVAEGRTARVLGDPAAAVAWLAQSLAERGIALAPGEIVLSGAAIGPLPILPGESYRAELDAPLGAVAVKFF